MIEKYLKKFIKEIIPVSNANEAARYIISKHLFTDFIERTKESYHNINKIMISNQVYFMGSECYVYCNKTLYKLDSYSMNHNEVVLLRRICDANEHYYRITKDAKTYGKLIQEIADATR